MRGSGAKIGPGLYLYAGSAKRGLAARLARHLRKRKPLRWHIDRLTVAGKVVGAAVGTWRSGLECRVAEALARRWGLAAAGFGSSDCRCPGHLVGPVDGGAEAALAAAAQCIGGDARVVMASELRG